MASQAGPKSGRVLVRMPISLHEALVNRAGGEEVSLNMLICTVLAREIGWKGDNMMSPHRDEVHLRQDIAYEMWNDRIRRRRSG